MDLGRSEGVITVPFTEGERIAAQIDQALKQAKEKVENANEISEHFAEKSWTWEEIGRKGE